MTQTADERNGVPAGFAVRRYGSVRAPNLGAWFRMGAYRWSVGGALR